VSVHISYATLCAPLISAEDAAQTLAGRHAMTYLIYLLSSTHRRPSQSL